MFSYLFIACLIWTNVLVAGHIIGAKNMKPLFLWSFYSWGKRQITTTTTTITVANSSTNQDIIRKKTNKTGRVSTMWWVPFQIRCQGQQRPEWRSHQEGPVWESLKEGLSSDGLHLHHTNLTRQSENNIKSTIWSNKHNLRSDLSSESEFFILYTSCF